MKICTKCKQEKSLSEFKFHPAARDKKQSWCKSCCNIQSNDWYKRNRTEVLKRMRNYNLKKNYGISEKEYNNMMENQMGRCLVCKKHHTEIQYPFCVDHDHETNKIRGLICMNCNTIIGHAHDNIEVLKSAIEYLELFK